MQRERAQIETRRGEKKGNQTKRKASRRFLSLSHSYLLRARIAVSVIAVCASVRYLFIYICICVHARCVLRVWYVRTRSRAVKRNLFVPRSISVHTRKRAKQQQQHTTFSQKKERKKHLKKNTKLGTKASLTHKFAFVLAMRDIWEEWGCCGLLLCDFENKKWNYTHTHTHTQTNVLFFIQTRCTYSECVPWYTY